MRLVETSNKLRVKTRFSRITFHGEGNGMRFCLQAPGIERTLSVDKSNSSRIISLDDSDFDFLIPGSPQIRWSHQSVLVSLEQGLSESHRNFGCLYGDERLADNSLGRWSLFTVYFVADGMLCYFALIVFIRLCYLGQCKVSASWYFS